MKKIRTVKGGPHGGAAFFWHGEAKLDGVWEYQWSERQRVWADGREQDAGHLEPQFKITPHTLTKPFALYLDSWWI